ncbi:Fc receptor-like protein 4 [Ammospiza caudacuta]|uniref:Fc receptor-like protein 4 n=1 Tax=Ammospiza caudacuta TaxID=2857398 RepID=UPI0027388D44|nr:Fc receptor-like protein 4 [Ammospiza caudacuta]
MCLGHESSATPNQPCPFSLPAQTLGLTAVLWDRVTLTCQGSGTAGATIWYKDGQRWWQERRDLFTVTEIGTYTCERPGTGLSSPVRVSDDRLVLQVPAWALLEGDTLTLRCRGRWNNTVTSVSFYRKGKKLGGLRDSIKLSLSPLQLSQSARLELQVSARELLEGDAVTLRCQRWRDYPVTMVRFFHGDKEVEGSRSGTELLLSPLQLHHSGNYSCRGFVDSEMSSWAQSAPVTVTVHAPYGPEPPSCTCSTKTGRWWGAHRGLLVPAMGVSHSGNYSCQVRSEGGAVRKSSAWIHITVRSDNVTLHCSVQVGSAPVTFTWLHNGQQVARGPLLELRDIDVGHSGTYQCMATNQLGQDGHRVFQAFSPELALEVTPGSPWVTVAAGVGGALLFLLLLLAVIVTWHRRHRVAARKNQERAPPDPLAPPEEGEVLYTHVVVTKRARASPRATTLQDPQVTYAELRGPQGRLQEPRDIYGNVL